MSFSVIPAILIILWSVFTRWFFPLNTVIWFYFTVPGLAINILLAGFVSLIVNYYRPLATNKKHALRFALPTVVAYLLSMVGIFLPNLFKEIKLYPDISYTVTFQIFLFLFVPTSVCLLLGAAFAGWLGAQSSPKIPHKK